MEIYIAKNGAQMGPYESGQIRQMLQSGILEKHDLYWHEGMLDWAPVASLGNQGDVRDVQIKSSSQVYVPPDQSQNANSELEDNTKKIIIATRICLGIALFLPLVMGPLGMLFGIFFSGPFALVSFILGIVILIKGRTYEGIIAIVLSILCPLLGWGLWIASMAFYASVLHK